jgi:large subunit ribosomal protein L32e
MAGKKSNKEVKDSKAETAKKATKKTRSKNAEKAVEPVTEEKPVESKPVEAKAEAKSIKGVRKESARAAASLVKPRPLPKPVEKSTLELDDETKRLLNARKSNKASLPDFNRIDSHKKAKLAPNWRRPKGHHSQLRRQRKSKGARVKAGYGSPVLVSGYHPSGYQEVIVNRPEDVKSVTKVQAIRVGGTVGKKKQMEIEKLAKELNIKVLNPLNTFEEVQ